jgi:N-acetylglucosamine-1-phosphate uridyltransferase (contains nucleotidyltransferase and I-patch acetyltransferase domains)
MNKVDLKNTNLFDFSHTMASELFENTEFPWEILPEIHNFIIEKGQTLSEDEYTKLEGNVWISKEADIASTASITGPTIIESKVEIRHCAYIRGNVIVGKGAVVGNSTELKNVILFDEVQVPHYNYVGDSILGHKSHMGAGAITSNVKADKSLVIIKTEDCDIATNIKKVGAILGDEVEIGCGSVLNPGTIIGKNANVYPLSSVRGTVNKDSIYKKQGDIIKKR